MSQSGHNDHRTRIEDEPVDGVSLSRIWSSLVGRRIYSLIGRELGFGKLWCVKSPIGFAKYEAIRIITRENLLEFGATF